MQKLIILFGLLLNFAFVNAQNAYTDSLEKQLKLPKTTPLEKMKIYGMQVEYWRSERLYDKATEVNKKLIAFAKKEKNKIFLTKAYVYQGIIFNNQDRYDKAVLYVDSTKTSAAEAKDKTAAAYSQYLQAYLADSYNDYKKAMTHGLSCLSLMEKEKPDFYLEFKLNYLLYGIYTEWNDLENTLKYAEKAVESALKSNNKNNLSNAYSALAVAYTYKYDATKSDADYQTILKLCENAASLYKDFPGQVAGYTYAMARNNKASYLLEFAPKITPSIRKQIENNIQESLSISQKLPNSQTLQAGSLGMLSKLASEDGNIDQAEQYLLQAYSILQTQKPVYYHIMIKAVTELSLLYEQKGNLGKALEFQKKVTEYRNLLFNQQEAESVKKLEAQYLSEKKEKEMQILKEKAETHKKQNYLFAGLITIGAIGVFFMFRSYHYNLRYSLAREKQLDAEKCEAELQIRLEKEEQSRLKTEQELLTLQQQKLQDEVMANHLHILHKNEVLHQLKNKLGEDNSLNINQIICEENLLDSDFEKEKFKIQEIHPNFFKILNEKAKQKLTSLDLKYCAYFYLGMNTKQIANILNVEPKSVRMTKYRLKQKFELDAEIDLIQFLKG